jgi:hypothetical protein
MLGALRMAVLESPGQTSSEIRTAASKGSLPEPMGEYVAKVRDQSYRITDNDIDALQAAGHSEDEIFEITVAAAVGAAFRSLDAGMRAMRAQG